MLDSQLKMGVRVEHEGGRLVDYQTVMGQSPIVSPRAYLQDAAFLVALTGPLGLLEDCRRALADPHWPIFLGRKSCPPARPIFEEITLEYESVKDALEHHGWDWYGHSEGDKPPEQLRCVIEVPDGDALRADRVIRNPARMYGTRVVKEFSVSFPGMARRRVQEESDGSCSSHS
jgi:CRISPR system Cascade subunit CasD